MDKILRIVLWTLILLLVMLALVVERPVVASLLGALNLSYYLKIVAVLGMIGGVFLAWGYKRKIETSQKYRHAQEFLSQAEATAKRRERACMLLEEKLKAGYVEKERALAEQVDTIKLDYQQQLMALKAQNMQLKDAVAKLLHALKQKGGHGPAKKVSPPK